MKPKIALLSIVFAILAQSLTAQPSFEWARQFGEIGDDIGTSTKVDAQGNVYVTGYFSGTIDFDPGASTYNLTSAGPVDVFISKLNAAGNFVWAKQLGGVNSDYGYSIALDTLGNVYTAGYFYGTADFDPGVGVYNLSSTGSVETFISKLDSSGNFVWAKQLGGPSIDYGYYIAVDSSANVYTTGYFVGTSDFDPGVNVFNLTSSGDYDVFISKLDASGNFVWAKQLGGTSADYGYGLTVDNNGNVYSVGRFDGTTDFDPGTGVFNLTTAGDADAFICKLNAQGNLVWAKQLGGTGVDFGFSVAVDISGNVHTTGRFDASADFDPGAGTYILTHDIGYDVFISKLDTAGNFVWAKQIGGTYWEAGFSISLDAVGNVYTTGDFSETTDFDPGTGVYNLIASGSSDVFISKLDAAGNFVWAKSFGGTNPDGGRYITTDASGNIYTTGIFQGIVDFDPGAGVFNLTSSGINDVFIHKMSNSSTGISENNFGQSITLFPNPTDGKVSINTNNASGIDAVIVRDILGNAVFVKNFSSAKQIEFTLEGTNGLYFAEIISGDNKSHAKVIKE